VVFSALVSILLYALISANGLVLGNDPAVHLSRAEMFLAMGRIPLGDVLWYPPLFHVWLATFIAFTGGAAITIEQAVFLLKCVTVLVNWLVIFSVYLLGRKFFGKKTGVLASSFLLISLPFWEVNFWGGYTSVASLGFMILLVYFLALNKKDTVTSLVIFMLTFFMVLTHQLTTFMAVLILGPFVLVTFFRSKGRFPKAWLAVILGGGLAFALYYSETIIPHIGDIIVLHILSGVQSLNYEIPAVTAQAFWLNFDFLLVFAAAGLIVGFFKSRENKQKSFFALLALGLLVPLLLTQTYLAGLLLPFERFIYYIVPFLAIFAAVAVAFIIDLMLSSYRKMINRRVFIKIAAVVLVALMVVVLVVRFEELGKQVNEELYYYSISDRNAYDAAVWVRENYLGPATTVVSEKPGSWFGLYSGKMVIAANNLVIQRNVEAECVLDLACEIEQPTTLIRTYDAKGEISSENYVSMDDVWKRATYFDQEGAFLSFEMAGSQYRFALSELTRELTLNFQNNNSKSFDLKYYNDQVVVTENITVFNDMYQSTVNWNISPVQNEISNVTLYLTSYFDGSFSFQQAYIPGVLNWESPWNKPSEVGPDNSWAVVNFTGNALTDIYMGAYDAKNSVAFMMKFNKLPEWGNAGVLANHNIDAFRFQYQYDNISPGQNASSSYQILTLSKSSYSTMPQLNDLKSVFDVKADFELITRNFADYIKDSNIQFVVYSRDRFYIELLKSNILTLVYSNDGYVVCSVKNSTVTL
jgi:hypothetical protein